MGGLIYCREPEVTEPYFAGELGVYLYSAEELCYYIVNYVLLLPQDFFNEKLYRFIGVELRRPELAGKLRKWLSQTPDMYQGILVLLQDIHFYSESELLQFKQKLDELRGAGPQELLKKKGDFFLFHIENGTHKDSIPIYGTGLSNIKAAIEKYEGTMEISVKGNIFSLDILFHFSQH